MEIKVGDCVEFEGESPGYNVFGYIARINGNESVDYLNSSLTRWNISKSVIERGQFVALDTFIERVNESAAKSKYKTPTRKDVVELLEKFKENFDRTNDEIVEIYKPLNVKL